MIGVLSGIVIHKAIDHLIIDVMGVGYIVHCSDRIISNLEQSDRIKLYIQTQAKENDINLFGFETLEQKTWFCHLISVQGVGPKLAMVILSKLNVDDLKRAIYTKDSSVFSGISGIGDKIALRIINELKNKAQIEEDTSKRSNNVKNSNINQSENIRYAVDALLNLGFNKQAAVNRVHEIQKHNPECSLEELIKIAISGGFL